MPRKYLSMVLIGLLACGFNPQIAIAQTNPGDAKERKRIEKLKTEVARLGVGKHARVIVRLKNGARLEGYISQAIEDSFDVTDPATRGFTTIPYGDVVEIEAQGSPKSTKISTRTALGIGIIATLIVLSAMKRNKKPNPRCPLLFC